MLSPRSEMTWKLQVKEQFFDQFAAEFDERHIDFLVYAPEGTLFADTFLWAESKKGTVDVPRMFAPVY